MRRPDIAGVVHKSQKAFNCLGLTNPEPEEGS